MEPNFKDGDYIVIDKISYYFREPSRSDAVVVESKETKNNFIKRIIGLPEERIEIKGGIVVIKDGRLSAGTILHEPYLASGMMTPIDTVYALDEDEYFLLGDNRLSSTDSRTMGAFYSSEIKGKVLFKIPFSAVF